MVAAILKITQQPGCIFVMSFCLRDFVQMAFDKPCYGCPWAVLFWAIERCSKLQNGNTEYMYS